MANDCAPSGGGIKCCHFHLTFLFSIYLFSFLLFWCFTLLASFSFFWAVSGKLIIFMLLSIIGIHHAGLWISSLQKDCAHILETAQKGEKKQIKAYYQKKQRSAAAFCVAIHIGILLVLKYTPFFSVNFTQ
mgnify:CR=1 FL=1